MLQRASLALCAVVVAITAHAQTLPKDTVVRVQAKGIEGGWHEGRMGTGGKCTMVFLREKTKGGYTSLALNAVAKLERQDGGKWVDVPVKPMLDREPKDCREAAND